MAGEDELGAALEQHIQMVVNVAMQAAQMHLMYGVRLASQQTVQIEAGTLDRTNQLVALEAAENGLDVAHSVAGGGSVAGTIPGLPAGSAGLTGTTLPPEVWGMTDPATITSIRTNADSGAAMTTSLNLATSIDPRSDFWREFYTQLDAATGAEAAKMGLQKDQLARLMYNRFQQAGLSPDSSLLASLQNIGASAMADRAGQVGVTAQTGLTPQQMGTPGNTTTLTPPVPAPTPTPQTSLSR